MSQKQQIVEYWQQNEAESFVNIAAHFSEVFNRKISYQLVYRLIDRDSDPFSNSLESLARRKKTPLDNTEQKQILQYAQQNSSHSVGKIARHFTNLLRKNVTAKVVSRIVRDADKLSCLPDDELEKELMKELYAETLTRLGFSQSDVNSESLPFFVTDKGIRSLAVELAGHEKFQGYFSTYKFGWRWIKKWREVYSVPSKPRSLDINDVVYYGTPTLKEKPLREKLRCLKEKLLEDYN